MIIPPNPRSLVYTLLACGLTSLLLLTGCDRQEHTPAMAHVDPIPQYTGTIIAVGDSLTAGLGVAEAETWPALLEQKLKENGKNWQVINAGISGETSSGALARIPWIIARKPDIVILATGANDGLRGIPPPVIREKIAAAMHILREGRVTVVLAGMQIVQNLGDDYSREFAAIYPAIADEQHCILVPFLLTGVAGEPSLNQEDTIHPNEEGQRRITETVFPYVLQAVQARR